MKTEHQNDPHLPKHRNRDPYAKLLFMAVLSFVSMYILMYAMVDSIGNVYPNLNQFYMASLMTAPMVVIELVLMGSMYPNKKLNAFLVTLCLLAGGGFFMLIQNQAGVSERQFLRGMIPHHAAAILMSEQSEVDDLEIKKLQREIISSQQREIDLMKAKLKELDRLER